jgi:hypothetical protein
MNILILGGIFILYVCLHYMIDVILYCNCTYMVV